MLLEKINSPSDIKGFNYDELRVLCKEIREYIVECCSRNPGHLASSLGSVELTVAVHYVFDTPSDKLIFDVGHQAYAHKIITGRREQFATMRTKDGISGFPRREESEYDSFGVGHSSTSISAALGMAEAARIRGTGEKVIALIGDGALTGGLAFEGLNNAGSGKSDLLVILNDNNQSIDSNLGGLHNHLLKITTNESYNSIKDRVWDILGEHGFRRFIQRWLKSLKSWLVKKSGGDIFEALGLRYFGPVDGHDVEQLVKVLRKIKEMKGPRVLHCITVKGKGYPQAEQNPTIWHAPGKFDPATGERVQPERAADRYQDVFSQVLCDLAAKDDRVIGITPAMASGCGMNVFAEKFPERFFDVGIEEEHAVTFSAGLAASGLRPVCNIYSSFSQRAYDQIIHDVALQKLPVILCFDRAGLVGEDGATHNGAFDLAAYRSIPDTIISAPADEQELKNLMHTALGCTAGPFIIRYPRGMGEGLDWRNSSPLIYEIGKAEEKLEGKELALIATGPLVHRCIEAAGAFQGRVGVYDFRFLKPLDTVTLETVFGKYGKIVTVEDGCLTGGLWSAVCEHAAKTGYKGSIKGRGIPDSFVRHARQSEQRMECGLDTVSLQELIGEMLKNN
ncbi:MAG: 1-deoxy-D-xylulose-5-phosphate synthase [Bacteroidales bacterium]|nr:1-deoxy-D-xylulose-5-phosphate synthase [Bacteroidales bacterium]